jgi:hypothetical protein
VLGSGKRNTVFADERKTGALKTFRNGSLGHPGKWGLKLCNHVGATSA